MMKLASILILIALPGLAQLTTDQKTADFRDLAAIYAKRYGPYEWKRDVFNFDLLNIGPWLDRVASTASDLDFYEVMVDYVSSLRDTHDGYQLPSSFSASLGIGTDIYDGKVVIDGINRSALPASTYSFTIGDEIVSVDGVAAADLVQQFGKYFRQGNPRSTARRAASLIPFRPQNRMPHAVSLGDTAIVVVRRQSGTVETYTLPWIKSGLPMLQVGPVPAPASAKVLPEEATPPVPETVSFELGSLGHSGVDLERGVIGIGSLNPVFNLPAGFNQRLGKASADYFVSGTYPASGLTIGFLRIPTYNPVSTAGALKQLDDEITYLQANTDGLIVDETRNPGGLLCYGEDVMSRLTPNTFRPIGYEIRATWEYVQLFGSKLDSAKSAKQPQPVIDQYQNLFNAVSSSYAASRGRTEAVPICGASFDRAPAAVNYSKPVIMITDEFSLSTADSVPAMFQDNARGPVVGWRTAGAGGSNSLNTDRWQVGAYSEGDTGVTLSLMVRKDPVTTPDFPITRYIENVGVRPDIQIDYMTLDNLLNGGKTFMSAITDVVVKTIQNTR